MRHRVLSAPTLVIGGVVMLIGLVLVGPSLLISLRYRPVSGVIMDAFPTQLEDGRVELAVLYQFDIHAGDLPGVDIPAHGLGYARCDRFGQEQGPLILDAAAADRFMGRIRGDKTVPTQVFYKPGDPLTTAMARITTSGGIWLSLPHLGLILVISPPLTWLTMALLRSSWRTGGSRRR